MEHLAERYDELDGCVYSWEDSFAQLNECHERNENKKRVGSLSMCRWYRLRARPTGGEMLWDIVLKSMSV